MNTTFHLRICGDDLAFARRISSECFQELDLIEGHLSLFREDSDVSRINHMKAGESLYLSDTCHACLLLALDFNQRTGGLFDVSLGHAIEHQKEGQAGAPPAIIGQLAIDPERPSITCHSPGRQIDFGGIGKGFALDQLRQQLLDRGVKAALLAAGASTQLAFGPHAWPIQLAGDRSSHQLLLKNQALSASGTGIQGSHIVHPDGPDQLALCPWKRIWLIAPSATAADVWSTAVMLMTRNQLRELSTLSGEFTTLYSETEGGMIETTSLDA